MIIDWLRCIIAFHKIYPYTEFASAWYICSLLAYLGCFKAMFKKQSIIEALAAGSNCIPPPPPPLPPAPVNQTTICGFNVAYRIDGQYPEWVGYLLSQMTMDARQKTANLENHSVWIVSPVPVVRSIDLLYIYICFISTAILEVYNNIIPDVNVQEIPLNSTPFRLFPVFFGCCCAMLRCFDACLSPVKLQLLTKWFWLFPHTAKTLSPDIYDAWARLYMTLCLC